MSSSRCAFKLYYCLHGSKNLRKKISIAVVGLRVTSLFYYFLLIHLLLGRWLTGKRGEENFCKFKANFESLLICIRLNCGQGTLLTQIVWRYVLGWRCFNQESLSTQYWSFSSLLKAIPSSICEYFMQMFRSILFLSSVTQYQYMCAE